MSAAGQTVTRVWHARDRPPRPATAITRRRRQRRDAPGSRGTYDGRVLRLETRCGGLDQLSFLPHARSQPSLLRCSSAESLTSRAMTNLTGVDSERCITETFLALDSFRDSIENALEIVRRRNRRRIRIFAGDRLYATTEDASSTAQIKCIPSSSDGHVRQKLGIFATAHHCPL